MLPKTGSAGLGKDFGGRTRPTINYVARFEARNTFKGSSLGEQCMAPEKTGVIKHAFGQAASGTGVSRKKKGPAGPQNATGRVGEEPGQSR